MSKGKTKQISPGPRKGNMRVRFDTTLLDWAIRVCIDKERSHREEKYVARQAGEKQATSAWPSFEREKKKHILD